MNKDSTDHVVKIDNYVSNVGRDGELHSDSYDGIPIYSISGLHAHVFDLLKKRLPAGAKVLELGAGSGAMSKRLYDNGYKVTSSDLVDGNFRMAGIVPFKTADLNQEFSNSFNDDFDAVIATELVEHIENVRHFFRQCKKLLKPGGYLLITTPNTENALSLAYQMRYGHHVWFSAYDYDVSGHINPLTSWHIKTMSKEATMPIEYFGGFGDIMNDVKKWPKMKVLVRIIQYLSKGTLEQGEILVCVCRKPVALSNCRN